MSLSATLKQATAKAHRRAESSELQHHLIRGTLDEECFTRYLAQLWCIHAKLEQLFDVHPSTAKLIDWSDAYRHSMRLEQDLGALGVVADDCTRIVATGRLLGAIESFVRQDPTALLGFFYVLEGSMNGNRFIVRALRRTETAARCLFAYFDPYGDEQSKRWAAIRVALDARQCRLETRTRRSGGRLLYV